MKKHYFENTVDHAPQRNVMSCHVTTSEETRNHSWQIFPLLLQAVTTSEETRNHS